MIKAAIGFVAGVAVGAAVTFFAMRGKCEHEKHEAVQEAWEDANEHYKRVAAAREKAMQNRKGKEQAGMFDDYVTAIGEAQRNEQKAAKQEEVDIKAIRKNAKKAMQSYRRNVFTDPPKQRDMKAVGKDWPAEDETDIYDEKSAEGPSEGLREEPYVISAEEWNDANRSMDQVTIYVYADGNCVDDNERLVDDIDACIGKENFEKLAELADEDGAVLIRNEMRSTDYELLLLGEPYIPDTAPVRDD